MEVYMARKSRRDLISEIPEIMLPEIPKEERIATAIYARLSEENNGRDDEESITSQLTLLRTYIRENPEFDLVDTYVDNGFTGTNFNRPEFSRLITDLNHGRVSCVIVKDLSRFGRNYIEAGFFIETIFPKLNVRLIAINDHFDSARPEDRDSISVPMKNMINEMYSRDASRKGIIAYRIKRNKENVLPNGKAPFGYKRNSTRTQYVVDREKADYVKLIFLWRQIGLSDVAISDRLNLLGVPLPSDGIKIRKCGWWTPPCIYSIVKNKTYLGNLYFGKAHNRLGAKGRVSKPIPEDQWVVHENTHEAIITKLDYELANAKRIKNAESRKKSYFSSPTNNLKTMVYCKECGRKMIPVDSGYNKRTKKRYMRFHCGQIAQFTNYCGNSVSEDFVKVIVMDSVRVQLKLMTDRADFIRTAKTSGNGKDLSLSIDKKIAYVESTLADEKEKRAKVFEDYHTGLLEKEDFDLISKSHASRIRELEDSLKDLTRRRDEYTRAINRYLAMIDELEINSGDDGYDDELVGKLVERVDITQDRRVEVVFKSNDFLDLLDEALKGGAA